MSITIKNPSNVVIFNDPNAPSGKITFSGVSSNKTTGILSSSGVLHLTGSADPQFGSTSALDNGKLSLSGSGNDDTSYKILFQKKFTWKVRKSETFSKTFTWQTGDQPGYFFRVTGKSKPAKCPPIGPSGSKLPNYTFVVNVYAHSVAEVCAKLINAGFIFPIKRIQRYTLPASKNDWTAAMNTHCDSLIDVTPSPTSIPCILLLIDFQAYEKIVFKMKAIPFIQCDGNGGLRFSGHEIPQSFNNYDNNGNATLSGSATIELHTYFYFGSGNLTLSNLDPKLTLSTWTWNGNGTLSTNASSALVTKNSWGWIPSGNIVFTGIQSINGISMTYVMKGGLKGNGGLVSSDTLPFVVMASGNLRLSNQIADPIISNHEFITSGKLTLSGISRFVSSAITIQMTNGFVLGGGFPYVVDAGSAGKISFTGLVTSSFRPIYLGLGKLSLSGTAGTISSVVVPLGKVSLSGVAFAQCSDLGTIVMPMNDTFGITQETIVFTYDPAIVLQGSNKRITTHCCPTLTLPSILQLEHQLATMNHFKSFLTRNKLHFASPVLLNYNSSNKTWYNTFHFDGLSPDYPTPEAWNINFTFNCESLLSPTSSQVSSYYWKLTALVSVKTGSSSQKITRLVLGFNPAVVCQSSRSLSFSFIFDTSNLVSIPATIQSSAFFDNIGAFKSPIFLRNPKIKFKISEVVNDTNSGIIPLGPLVTASQLIR